MKAFVLTHKGKPLTIAASKAECWCYAMRASGYSVYHQLMPSRIVAMKKNGFEVVEGSFTPKGRTRIQEG